MRKMGLIATMVLAGVLGCNPMPVGNRTVSEAELPAAAKSLLGADASIDRVVEMTMDKGHKIYRLYYTQNGEAKSIDYNDNNALTPTGVFEMQKKK
jgi:hypothetical protein